VDKKAIEDTPSISVRSENSNDTIMLDSTEITVKDFDVLTFISSTSSLLTSIEGKPISPTCSIDTITNDKITKQSPFNALFPSTNVLVKRYSFDPGKNSRALRIWVVSASYADSLSSNRAFTELHRQSTKVDDKENYSPGLTYTNDYVIKTDKNIYWLNSGCAMSFKNHKRIKEYLLKALPVLDIQDSIWCKCGQPDCSL